MPHYLYGLVSVGTAVPSERGVADGEVSVLPVSDELAVLRSQIERSYVQPRRAHLAAHDRVLAAAMATGPTLPLRFGVITDGHPAVVLEELDVAAVLARMQHLSGRVEVQVLWEPEEDVAVRRVAERHPEVRDRTVARIDRGRRIAQAMSELAVEDLATIREELADLVVTTGPVEARGSSARVAALIGSDRLGAFLDACEEIAGRVASAGALRTVGALPPYSFATLDRGAVGA